MRKRGKRHVSPSQRAVSFFDFVYFYRRLLNVPTVILPTTPAAETLSSAEVQKRADSHNACRALLGSNPSLYVSKTRLSIRQIPTFLTERMLKLLAMHAMQAFDEEVASGNRTGLSEEELT